MLNVETYRPCFPVPHSHLVANPRVGNFVLSDLDAAPVEPLVAPVAVEHEGVCDMRATANARSVLLPVFVDVLWGEEVVSHGKVESRVAKRRQVSGEVGRDFAEDVKAGRQVRCLNVSGGLAVVLEGVHGNGGGKGLEEEDGCGEGRVHVREEEVVDDVEENDLEGVSRIQLFLWGGGEAKCRARGTRCEATSERN